MSRSVVIKQNQGFLSDLPLGSIIPWHRDLDPAKKYIPQLGWVECNGQTLDDKESPFHGQVIPNLNGEGRFLRGAEISGVLQADHIQSHTHEDSGHTHVDEGHSHSITDPKHSHLAPTASAQPGTYEVAWSPPAGHDYGDQAPPTDKSATGISITENKANIQSSKADLGNPTASTAGEPRHGSETRPINMSVVWIMKVKQVAALKAIPAVQADLKAPAGAMYVNEEGNVGIGTTSPAEKLHVDGNLQVDEALRVKGPLTVDGNVGIGTANPIAPLHIAGNSQQHRIAIAIQDTLGGHQKTWLLGNDGQPGKFGLMDGSYLNYRWIVDANGNVGIGTTSPTTATGGRALHIDNPNGASALRLGDGAANGRQWEWQSTVIGSNGAMNLSNLTDWTNPFTVLANGNVGIGTTDPQYKLHVASISYAATSYGWGFDYAEYFESLDGMEIPPGTSVVLEEDKIRPAQKGETPIGVISANSVVVGGVPDEWPKKYLRDEFGRQLMEEYQEEITVPKKEKVTRQRQKVERRTVTEEVTRTAIVFENGKYCQKEITETISREVEAPLFEEVDLYDAAGENVIGRHRVPVMETYEEEIEIRDENGQPVMVGSGEFVARGRPKLNPEYDPSYEYVPREQRPEWNCVGLLGKLPLRKGQPVAPSWIKLKDLSDDVELWLVK